MLLYQYKKDISLKQQINSFIVYGEIFLQKAIYALLFLFSWKTTRPLTRRHDR